MANRVDLELMGIESLIAEVEKLGKKGNAMENKALKRAGAVVKEAIQKEAPVKTGKLKESMNISGIKTKDGVKRVEVGPHKDAFYAKFLEFGTSKMAADPFMERGYEASKGEAMDTIKDELKKGLGL